MNATRFLKLAPVKVQAAVERMSDAQRQALAKELDAHLQASAWKLGYLEHYGPGPLHNRGVKRANRLLTDVRKAIGYTLPGAASINV